MSWSEVELTGQQRFRVGWFGKLILQVEYVEQFAAQPCPHTFDMPPWDGKTQTGWRDARLEDITTDKRAIKQPQLLQE